ncbi:MAG TPA: amidohydrolase family protein [Thermotogota bacterium]|nr:amidohydrolase family protein [Thermotogota bacterium]HRW91787.1 amidohydrolase family protein [Thermotogota bacterium]
MNPHKKFDLVIKNGSLLYGTRSFHVHICISEGKIAQIMDAATVIPETEEIVDATGMYIFPGFIDPHVHFGLSLGEETSADDFESGSLAAAWGGITTLFDFTEVVTGDVAQLEQRIKVRQEQASKSLVNVRLHLAVAQPQIPPAQLVELALRHRCHSIKVFTTYSESDRKTNDGYLYDLLKASKGSPVTIMVHAENDDIIGYRMREIQKKRALQSGDLPFLNPTLSETEAALRVCLICKETGGTVYLAHISSGRTVELLERHFSDIMGKQVFVESCPHYFYLNDTFLKGDLAYLFTCRPPLRSEQERVLLRQMLKRGLVHSIGTDHCPFSREAKERHALDYATMPNGLGSVELSFSLMYNLFATEFSQLLLGELVKMYTQNPAQIFGLFPHKGVLAPGSDADITLFDPGLSWKVSARTLHGRGDYSVYDGLKLTGKVHSTICGGQFIIREHQRVG